jgi:hypothetical protein
MYTIEEIESLPMPVGWCDNSLVVESLAALVQCRSDAIRLIDRLGPSSNLNAIGCLLGVVRRYCMENREGSLELMTRLFDRCRFQQHSLFLNTFLPFVVDHVEEFGFPSEDHSSVVRICEAAMQSVEGLCAYGIRCGDTLELIDRLLKGFGSSSDADKMRAELARVMKLYEMRWANWGSESPSADEPGSQR